MDDVVIKKSTIKQFPNGLGVFANKNFNAGDVVIHYHLRILTPEEFQNLPDDEKMFVHVRQRVIYLYSLPERYVNHCDKPNTIQDFTRHCDIALRSIKKGEEITTNAQREDS